MNVVVADEQDQPVPNEDVLALAEHVLASQGVPESAEVTIVFVDEDRIAEYNERYLGREGPTDVLSFPVEEHEPGRPPKAPGGGAPLPLGDLFICPAVVRRNAEARGIAFDDELALVVTHGLLHLLGWDHDEDADRMEAEERRLLTAVGRSRP